LLAYKTLARPVTAKNFKRLPLYFSKTQIEAAKFVVVNRVPVPPLSSMGLSRFNEFERGDYDGITYLDTYFLKRAGADDESLHFHEMIHLVQWRLLGAEFFLAMYAGGLEKFGYRNSPLERGSVALRKIACGSSEGLTMRPLKAVDPRAHVGRSTRTGGDVSCKCRSASITR